MTTQLHCSRGKRNDPAAPAAPPSAPATSPAPSNVESARTEPLPAPSSSAAVGVRTPGLKLEKPIDLGAPGALVATDRGVIFRTRDDELTGVPLAEAPARLRAKESADGTRALRGPPLTFARSSHVYWVTRGKLVRRAFNWDATAASGPLEVLANDAHDGTRVAAETLAADPGTAGRDVALYIARAVRAGDERVARAWVEGAGTIGITSEGSGASSVALAKTPTRLLAISLDARAAMSPVHARTIEVGFQGPPRLGSDVVVFVGPPPESHIDVAAVAGSEGPVAFIPFARDTSSFGLASLAIGSEPHLDAPVQWNIYPGGIDPAPVDGAVVCQRVWTAYARPSDADGGSPNLLELSPVDGGAFGRGITAGQGFDFSLISMAARADGGAWLAWVGNGRSWVRGLKCS
ncbi:MAG TPA: hypothetical protein VF881_09375 [Polyangiaceae bacterium]